MRQHEFDVAVIGGGPGGSTVAGLLARSGHSVVVLERSKFPRTHIGESLNPEVLPILDKLGATQRVQAAGFVVKHGAVVHHRGASCRFHFCNARGWTARPVSYQVTRSEFDAILLDCAKGHGARVLQPAHVKDVHFDGEIQIVRCSSPTTGQFDVRCRFVVDAAGHQQFLASRLGLRQPIPGLDGIEAVYTHFKDVAPEPPPLDGYFQAYLVKNGWIWFIPLKDGVTSVGSVRNGRERKSGEANSDYLTRMLSLVPEANARLANSRRVAPIYRRTDMSYDSTRYSGKGYVLVGDAAFFVDPVFSSGAFLAMRMADLAAHHIGQALGGDSNTANGCSEYDAMVRRDHRTVVDAVRLFYAGLRHPSVTAAAVRAFQALDGRSPPVRRLQNFGNGRFADEAVFLRVLSRFSAGPLAVLDRLNSLSRRVIQ